MIQSVLGIDAFGWIESEHFDEKCVQRAQRGNVIACVAAEKREQISARLEQQLTSGESATETLIERLGEESAFFVKVDRSKRRSLHNFFGLAF